MGELRRCACYGLDAVTAFGAGTADTDRVLRDPQPGQRHARRRRHEPTPGWPPISPCMRTGPGMNRGLLIVTFDGTTRQRATRSPPSSTGQTSGRGATAKPSTTTACFLDRRAGSADCARRLAATTAPITDPGRPPRNWVSSASHTPRTPPRASRQARPSRPPCRRWPLLPMGHAMEGAGQHDRGETAGPDQQYRIVTGTQQADQPREPCAASATPVTNCSGTKSAKVRDGEPPATHRQQGSARSLGGSSR